MSESIELKPCPFCGSSDVYARVGIYIGKIHESVTIICCECEANIWGATEEKAIDVWNRRANESDWNQTDELRRLLEERGVEYDGHLVNHTTWESGGVTWAAHEYNGKFDVWIAGGTINGLTPEQAIAATLGPKVCHMSYNELSNTSICLACGWRMDGKPNYCPNCGAKVVDE